MSDTNSVWEQRFRQPTEFDYSTDISQLRQQLATTNSLAQNVKDDTAVTQGIVTLFGTWVNFTGGFQTARAFKHGEMVTVEGLVRAGLVTAGSIIGILPVGYRPAASVMFTCWCQMGSQRVDVNNAGHIVLAGEGTGNPATYQSISGITFHAG